MIGQEINFFARSKKTLLFAHSFPLYAACSMGIVKKNVT
jgi:hypothetical protein